MSKVFITENAHRDIEGIFTYIANDDLQAAYKIADELYGRIGMLEKFPDAGFPPKDDEITQKGYLILVVHKFLIFYVSLNDTVEIRYVIHGSRAYGKLIT